MTGEDFNEAAGYDEWVHLFANRDEMAEEYARQLPGGGSTGWWAELNAAIMRRWSPAGLAYIKTRAWKIATGKL